jgi:hypothetical protein
MLQKCKIYNADSNCCTNPPLVLTLYNKYCFDEYEIGMHKVGLTAGQAALVRRRYVKK